MLRVCALANQIGGPNQEHLLALERSLARKDMSFFFFLESGPWVWERKIEWELELTETHPDDHFVFIDAFDVLFVGEKEETEAIVQSIPLLFPADCGVAPYPLERFAPLYEAIRPRLTPWCWLNGSGPAGLGSAIAEAAVWGLKNIKLIQPSPRMPRGGTDQYFWSIVYLSEYGELDQQCRLTQVLYDTANPGEWVTPHLGHKDGRVVNLLTGSRPQFIHATGNSWEVIPKGLIP